MNRTLLLAVVEVIVSLCSMIASGQEPMAPPVPMIEGPVAGQPGDIVLLDATKSTAQHLGWLVDVTAVTVPMDATARELERMADVLRTTGAKVEVPPTGPVTHLIVNDGRQIILSSYPGTYRVVLAVSNEYGVKLLQWQVRIQTAPNPPPGPVPNPGPDDPQKPDPEPDPPVNTFGLADFVATQVRSSVSDNGRRDKEALLFYGAYRATVAAIDSDAIKSIEDVITFQAEANKLLRMGLGAQRGSEWEKVTGSASALAGKLKELDQAGRLKTLDDVKRAWSEIRDGFGKVAGI